MSQINVELFINGIKKRSSIVIEVPIEIENLPDNPNFFKTYEGNLETVIKYKEFYLFIR